MAKMHVTFDVDLAYEAALLITLNELMQGNGDFLFNTVIIDNYTALMDFMLDCLPGVMDAMAQSGMDEPKKLIEHLSNNMSRAISNTRIEID